MRNNSSKIFKIGLPRALFFYKQPVFWQKFFNELDCEVILSPPTNKEILNNGCQITESENCLPIKVFNGHLFFLKDKADYIFVPYLKSLKRNHLSCVKLFALPDLASFIINKRKLISPRIDLSKSKLSSASRQAGFRITKNFLKIKRAHQTALIAEKEEEQKRHFSFFKKIQSLKRKMVVISHQYNLYDNFLNAGIKDELEKLEVEVININDIPFKENPTFSHWDCVYEIMNQIKECVKYDISGAIQILSFNCGCDSIMKDFVEMELKKYKIPFLPLMLDEHTGRTGVITRLEAFIDTLN